MIIGLDAKRAYRNATGLGNYSRVLLAGLADFPPTWTPTSPQLHLFGPTPHSTLLALFDRPLFHHHHPQKVFHQTFPSLWRSKGIIDDLMAQKVDLYHGLSAELPFGISKTPIKSIVTVHDLIFLKYPENYTWFDKKIYTYKLQKAIEESDHIVATSNYTAADLTSVLNVNPAKISVHYQDCQPWFKGLNAPSSDVHHLTQLGIHRPYLLVVGTIEKRKNGYRLAQAFKQALEHEPIDLVFAGKPTSFLKQILSVQFSKSANAKIRILDQLPMGALPELYKNCLFHVYVSEYEGFGIPILEALNAQKTSLTSQEGCFNEVGGEAVLYCDAFSVESIANGLRTLYFNENLRMELEGKSITQANKFSTISLVNQTWDLYRRLLSE